MADVEVDYHTLTPQDFDRFGVRQHVTVRDHHRVRVFTDADPRGVIKRLGLTLRGWGKRWPGMEVFHLDIWDRPLEIRSYSDGRIKLFLDRVPVYTEDTKIVTRGGVKHREVEKWFDPEPSRQESEAAEQERLEALRARLGRRSAANSEGNGPVAE